MIRFIDQVNTLINFGGENLPVLISGKEGSGASFFSVSLASHLFLNGKKLVFFSARDEARSLFFDQTEINSNDYVLVNESSDILNIQNQKVIFIKAGATDLLLEFLQRSVDYKDRIIFVKNIEETLSASLFILLKNNNKFILSGDLDKSEICESVSKASYDTKIFFSGVDKLDVIIPQIPKRQAVFLRGKQRSKIIKVVVE